MSDNKEPVPTGWGHIDPPLSADELLAQKKALECRMSDDKEDQRDKIRAQLKEEITHPTIWYPMSKKQVEQSHKLKSDLSNEG